MSFEYSRVAITLRTALKDSGLTRNIGECIQVTHRKVTEEVIEHVRTIEEKCAIKERFKPERIYEMVMILVSCTYSPKFHAPCDSYQVRDQYGARKGRKFEYLALQV
jgi:hypothetical protein